MDAASFNPGSLVLSVFGDNLNNSIVASRNAAHSGKWRSLAARRRLRIGWWKSKPVPEHFELSAFAVASILAGDAARALSQAITASVPTSYR